MAAPRRGRSAPRPPPPRSVPAVPADPRRVAKWARRRAPIWLVLMVPNAVGYFIIEFETFVRVTLLETVLLSFYAAWIGDKSAEQAAESRYPEDED